MADTDDLVIAFELHAFDQIRAILDRGLDPRAPIRGKAPVNCLLEMYSRSAAFPACLPLMLDRRPVPAGPALPTGLLDAAEATAAAIRATPSLIDHRTTM